MRKKFFVFPIFCLWIFSFFGSARAQEARKSVKFVLAGVVQYKDYADIKKALFKMEGLDLAYETSTQKLQVFKGTYVGEIPTLLSNLGTDLPPRFTTRQKTLPSQATEITILPQ